MKKHRAGKRRLALVVAVAAALTIGAYAFTATNTVPDSYAGAGSGTISGYTITDVEYELNATTPSNIDSVSFTLDAAATTVKAKLVAASTTFTDCTVSGGVDVTCDFSPDVAVTAADELEVIATS